MAEPVRVRRNTRESTTHEGTMIVTASGVGIDKEKRKTIEVRKFETEPAYVRVNAGVTRNLGNYESLRIDVSLSVPCYVEEIEKVQPRVASLVADMLAAEQDEYMGKTEE